MTAYAANHFVKDIWYFAGLVTDIKPDGVKAFSLAGEPIVLAREGDTIFALRDICPHRAAPLSAGCVKSGTVECPYHGWTFGLSDGQCKSIPALPEDNDMDVGRIAVRTYPVRQTGPLIWVYLRSDPKDTTQPAIEPPQIDLPRDKPSLDDGVQLGCHIDHAVIGLMDPAHGPYVHRQWWWRSEKSIHEKAKDFAPRERGFAMVAHAPSSNSFAYKILGGKPVTEITFRLPAVRTEEITIGKRKVLSFTALIPIDVNKTEIRQLFFTDHPTFRFLSPMLGRFARTFLRQDSDMVDLQQKGLKHDPRLMLIEDADTQAKWYYALKKAWAKTNTTGEPFVNPVKPCTLRWRS
jgi:phenylpropionate dioxygenase-like ring-hydroxylating dioxygenase large terminal subunit